MKMKQIRKYDLLFREVTNQPKNNLIEFCDLNLTVSLQTVLAKY